MSIINDPYVTLLAVLAFKHFWADGPFQLDYMAFNKGKFLHWGGVSHALTHGVCTLLALGLWFFLSGKLAAVHGLFLLLLYVVLAEVVTHYFIDLFMRKLTLDKNWIVVGFHKDSDKKLVTIRDRAFYRVLVADQCLHMMTYVVMASIIITALQSVTIAY